jgi:hypothetical protein
MLQRPPKSLDDRARRQTANAARVAGCKTRAAAGRTTIGPDVDVEAIQRLLIDNRFMEPADSIDWDLATTAERRQARATWSRGVSQLLDLLVKLEMHFPAEIKK